MASTHHSSVHVNMFTGGGFMPFVLDYAETKNHAVRSLVCSDEFSAGGHLWRIECYPHGTKTAAKNGGEYVSLFVSLMSKSGSAAKRPRPSSWPTC